MKKFLAVLLAVVCVAAMSITVFAAQYEEEAELVAIVALKPEDDSAENTSYKYIFKVSGDPQAWIDAGKNAYEMWWGVGPKQEDPLDCSKCKDGWSEKGQWISEEGFATMTVTKFNPADMNAGEEYAAAKAGNMIGYICELTAISYVEKGGINPEKDDHIVDAFARHPVGIKANCTIEKSGFATGEFDGVVLPLIAEESFSFADLKEDTPVTPPATGDTLVAVVALIVASAAGVVLVKKH